MILKTEGLVITTDFVSADVSFESPRFIHHNDDFRIKVSARTSNSVFKTISLVTIKRLKLSCLRIWSRRMRYRCATNYSTIFSNLLGWLQGSSFCSRENTALICILSTTMCCNHHFAAIHFIVVPFHLHTTEKQPSNLCPNRRRKLAKCNNEQCYST